MSTNGPENKNPYQQFEDELEARTQDSTAIDNPKLPPTSPPEAIPGDRGEPVTKAAKKGVGKKVIATMVFIVGVLMVIGGFVWFMMNSLKHGQPPVEEIAVDTATTVGPGKTKGIDDFQESVRLEQKRQDDANKAKEEQVRAAMLATENANKAPDLGNYGGAQAGSANTGNRGSTGNSNQNNGQDDLTPAQRAALRRHSDDVLWAGSGAMDAGGGGARPVSQTSGDPTTSHADTTISDSMRSERLVNGTVGVPFNLKYMLKRGEYIPCTLLPQIITNYAGFVDCTVNRDVYSADGSILLINRGAVAHGERKVAMARGVSSVFASFGEIVNTDGTPIYIGSLATNNLGATGIDAEIDNHNMERFGGAVLLAGLDDAFKAISKKASGGGSAEFDNSTNNASDIASKALDSTVNISPTGYVKHGNQIYIYVSRNVDFSSHYGVK